jgi:protein O-GlcNAc transferase
MAKKERNTGHPLEFRASLAIPIHLTSRKEMTEIRQLLDQGKSLHQEGRLTDAWKIYEEVLRRSPGDADALHLSGVIANLTGQPQDALRRIGEALQIEPRNAVFHLNYGNALLALGKSAEAEAAFRKAIKVEPRFASAHYNLANLLLEAGKSDEAIAEYDQTVVHEPRHFGALFALARLMAQRKQWPPCIALARRALDIQPAQEELLRLAAAGYYKCGRYGDARNIVDRLLGIHPGDAALIAYKGDIAAQMSQYDEAISCFRQALRIDPAIAEAVNGLGDTLIQVGKPDEAVEVLREGIVNCPTRADLFSDYLFMLNYKEDALPEFYVEEHRRWDQLFGRTPRRILHNVPNPDRRLRVGYVSADFRSHSVSYFIEPIIERHDRKAFSVHCFSSTARVDSVTERLRSKADSWHDVAGVSDEELTDLITKSQIDILVDLAGHTGANRLGVFARKPAPVQISYLGYPNTTGLSAIDYRISDREADPPGVGDAWNTETVLRLPDCFHCYRPPKHQTAISAPPCIERGYVSFGSFNILSKISDSTLRAWARILSAVPNSQVLIKTRGLAEAVHRDLLSSRMEKFGIAADRVELSQGETDHAAHMQRYREVDIALDTFPYNGTTTTCDALWMGVPVVALAGNRHAARVSSSLLKAAALNELVADNVDDYVALAIGLATDASRLSALHAGLRERLQTSPLMDEERFTRNIEMLYRDSWHRWCEKS